MKITKFGHSCLLVEEEGLRVLIDPGNFNEMPSMAGVDVLLLTHEHQDHCDIESVQAVIVQNPGLEIITHVAVGQLLSDAGIAWTAIADGESLVRKGVSIEGFGIDHACIHHDIPLIRNTGYLIAGRFYHPGDALHVPAKSVEILALPVSGPWLKIEEAVEYAKKVQPKVVFPIHDGMLVPERVGGTRIVPPKILTPLGIEFRDAVAGSAFEF